MFDTKVRHSRPVRVFDGEGSVERIGETGVLWCDPIVQANNGTINFGSDDDVRVGDLIEIPHTLFE